MIVELLAFFLIALFSGLFYPVFHFIIGAPKLVPDLSAGDGAQFVKTLEITKPGMIFRGYGKWLCRMQNQWDKKHDKSRAYNAKLPEDFETINHFLTSYNRSEDEIGEARIVSDGKWVVFVDLLPGEVAHIVYNSKSGKVGQVPFKQVYPNFDHSKMPLSIFKAMGLCGPCTTFWIMLTVLLTGYFFGFFSGLFIASPLIVPAYGLAIWAQQTYSLE